MRIGTKQHLQRKALTAALTLCFTAGGVATAVAHADEAPQDNAATSATSTRNAKPKSLGAVIVTAQKREQPAIDVPASVTSLDTTSLVNAGMTQLQDYAAQIPGLSLTSIKPGEAQVTIRGITTGLSQSAPTTSIYIDEAPIGSVNAYTVGSQLVPDLDPATLNRIEVLKGPQGTLYGAGAMGGLLRYVTLDPNFQKVQGSVTIGVDSVDHGGNGTDVRAFLNLPLSSNMALQANVFNRTEGGFIDDVNGRKDVNTSHEKGGRVAYSWIINPNWKLDVWALTQRVHDNDNPTEDVDGKTLQPIYAPRTQNVYIAEPSNSALNVYNATLHGQIGNFALVSSTTYQTVNANAVGDVTPTYGALLGPLLGIPDLGTGISQYTRTHRFSEEVRADSSAFDDKLQYEFGVYFTHEIDSNAIPGIDPFLTSTGQPLDLPFQLIKASIDSTYREYSGFANATYAFTSKFSVQAGVRYSSDQQTYGQNYSGLLVGPTPLIVTNGHESGDKATYLLTASYKPTDNDALYARIATGYRPGGPNAVPPPTVYAAPSTFKPDSLTSYEIGYKSVLDGGDLSFETALFTTNWKNIQVQTSEAGFNFFVNGGTAVSRGAEATVLFYPVNDWSIRLNGSYTDAHLTENAPLAGGLNGDELPFVPKGSGALSSEYHWAIGGGWTASIGGSVNYIGVRRSDYSLRAPVDVPSYTTLNLDASLSRDAWQFTLYAKNLTDSDGIIWLETRAVEPGLNPYQAAIIQPRTIGLDATYRF